ncbi:unnamed protein product [Heligmosomoides polygyrus]|uniref:NUP50 domain-containing protein n=1 Tax=Heligmosomoides polygyrus TaxID=6339 RepID=A0A183FDY3_HELPZ|nr:unnamed protein product [Heligmosomoides polygyrus]
MGTTAAGAAAEKETVRDGVVPKPIREVAIQIREKLKENRKLADEFTSNSSDLTIKVKEQLKESSMTVADLKVMLSRFDVAFSRVANKLFEASRKVQDAKSVMTADGSLYLPRETARRRGEAPQSFNRLRGNDFVPSQSSIAELGKQLKPAATGAPAGTGTGLFGSTTGGSLFGSGTTASKPFSFATTSSGGTSLFPSLTTSTAGSLFSSLTSTAPTTSKPTLSFGSTFSNNSSGLLFSSKK